MVFDIETGNIRITASGENAVIVRKGKKIKIPSVEVQAKLIEGVQKGGDRTKLDAYTKDYPKLEDGDAVVCGSKTTAKITSDYNKGKEKPIDDWKSRASKSVDMGPNSELAVSGFESWDETDKDKKRNHGELIKNIELKKGFFLVSYSNTDDELITPTATIKFLGDGGTSGSFDVYENILYSNAGGEKGVEYTNRQTKGSYVAKSTTGGEIIVDRNGIYKKGILKMDDIFSPMNTIGVNSYFSGTLYKAIPEMDAGQMAASYKNIPNVMQQAAGAFEMFGQMTPEDLERLMKMGEEKGGAKVTPEMMQQMKELPEAMKAMQKAGFTDQMKKAMAMSKGMMEGLGDKGIDQMVKMQTKGMKKAKEAQGQLSQVYSAEGASSDVGSLLESPRRYKPLTDAKKVA
jgi:hypothetical protein